MTKILEKQTLFHFFEYLSEKYAPNPSVAFIGQEPISYENFSVRVREIKNFLKECGIRESQKVVLLGDNSINWGIAYFAITTLGAVVVPILSEFPEADINHIIKHSEAKAAFIDEKIFQTSDLSALDALSIIISLEKFATLKSTPYIENTPSEEILKHSNGKNIEEDQLAEILYTSGTTGHSKGVMLTHKNIISNALSGPARLGGLDESSIILNILPLAHAYGCTTSFLGSLSVGASIYFLDKKPSPKILMDALQEVRPTIVTGVPLIFEKIYHKKVLPELTNRKSLRFISNFKLGRKLLYRKIGKRVLQSFGGRLYSFVIGGASLNREVEIFLREAKIPFAIGYGLSECAPLVSGDYYDKLKMGSVGRIIPEVQVKIIDADAESGVGEICVKGPNVMLGYYKNEKENSKVFTQDGWLRTGDLGFLDSDGYLFIKGRSKNVYVGASGENIYPEIVEDRLRESMFVEEALVYMDNEKLIGRVYLDYEYIQNLHQAENHPVQPEEIDNILENVRRETNLKLPAFSQIKRILEQIEPFVKTPTNKIKRILYIPDYGKN
jgi:long-chain acyl-CoA synthetase